MIVCLPAAYVAVALRFLARHLRRAGIGKDDIAIIIALVRDLETFSESSAYVDGSSSQARSWQCVYLVCLYVPFNGVHY